MVSTIRLGKICLFLSRGCSDHRSAYISTQLGKEQTKTSRDGVNKDCIPLFYFIRLFEKRYGCEALRERG